MLSWEFLSNKRRIKDGTVRGLFMEEARPSVLKNFSIWHKSGRGQSDYYIKQIDLSM